MSSQQHGKEGSHMDSPARLGEQATALASVPSAIVPHSPLPWRIGTDETFGGQIVPDCIEDADGGDIDGGGVVDEDDARYIVTACNAYPELVEALQFAEGAIWEAICNEDGLDGSAGERVIKMIRAALTAAGAPVLPVAGRGELFAEQTSDLRAGELTKDVHHG